MAQPMMHLLIADKIYSEKSSSIHSYGEFLLGSIAPDAVHMREDCTRELKRVSHYRFDRASQISYLDTFLDEYKTSENGDFAAGYLVHILSDMVWYHSVRVPFKEAFELEPSRDMSLNEAYYADCEQIEQLMFFEPEAPRIIEAINSSRAYSLDGLIDSQDVEAWKNKLIINYNSKKVFPLHTQYISEQHIRDYITNCAKECTEYLSRLPHLN